MSIKHAAVTGRKDLYTMDPRLIKVEDGFNPRQDFGDIESLRDSIIQNGVEQAIKVCRRGDDFIITDGHRRHRATMLAVDMGYDIKIPAQLDRRGISDTERLISAFVSNDSEPLKTFEEAELFRRLVAYGETIVSIAKRIGKHKDTVERRLALVDAIPALKVEVTNGNISATDASAIVKESDGDTKKQEQEIDKAKKGGRKYLPVTVKKNITTLRAEGIEGKQRDFESATVEFKEGYLAALYNNFGIDGDFEITIKRKITPKN